MPDTSLSSARGDPRKSEAAVAELLRDHGASPADAASIAAHEPGYAALLADCVRELDELGLWGVLDRPGRAEMGALGFGWKVYLMGRSRRGGGVVPLVESLSSAKLYVAAEGLPVVIHRVVPQLLKKRRRRRKRPRRRAMMTWASALCA